MLIANSSFIPLPAFLFGNHKFVIYVCESVLYISSFVSFFFFLRFHTEVISFVFLCLTSLSMIMSRSIHFAANGTI